MVAAVAMANPLVRARSQLASAVCAATRRLFTGTALDFDHRWGVDTGGGVPPERLAAPGLPAALRHGYEGIPVGHLRYLLRRLPAPAAAWSFVDIGSGKGRAVLVAAGLPFRRVVGIEAAPALHVIARHNLDRYRGPSRCAAVELICGDATATPLPPGDVIAFHYNAVRGPLLARLLDHLAAAAATRRVLLAYSNPAERAAVDRHPGFRHLQDIVSPPDPVWWGNRRTALYAAGPSSAAGPPPD